MNQQDRDNLQRFVDGELTAPERAVFEQRLADDAELRAELELLERVESSLQRSFAVPDIRAPLPPDSRPLQPSGRRWPQFLAGAISAAAVLLIWLQPWSNHDAVMRTAVGRSWLTVCGQPETPAPQSGCVSSNQVPDYVKALAPDLPSPLVWNSCDGVRFRRGVEPEPLNGLRVLELVVLPQTEVYLFVVPASADPRPALPKDSDWRLFRKDCGALVLYELTPLAEPHGLQCLSAGD